MSDAVFPTLPGLSWGIQKTPTWSTKIQKAVTGREIRISYMPAPMVKFSLPYDFLRDKMTQQNPSGVYAELRQLMGFYLARQGSFDSFLYEDTTDNTATVQPFGLGDGGSTAFQLLRSFGSQFAEAIENVKEAIVYINGVEPTTTTYGSAWNEGADTYPSPGSLAPLISYGSSWDENADSYTSGTVSQVNPLAINPTYTVGNTGIVSFPTAPPSGSILTWTGTYYYRCRFDSDSYDFEQMMQDIWSLSSIELYGSLQNRI